MSQFSWVSEVRAHEIDVQGIVNNAYYLTYFDHVRTLHLKNLKIDWAKLSQEGYNLVLIQAEIKFLHPLRAFDSFEVRSILIRDGRLKLVFDQSVINQQDRLVCRGINTVVCVDSSRNKPIHLDKIANLESLS